MESHYETHFVANTLVREWIGIFFRLQTEALGIWPSFTALPPCQKESPLF